MKKTIFQESDFKIVLKKSCSRCITLKRKCDSTKPTCLRCTKMGALCSYEIANKRGRKSKIITKNQSSELLFSMEEKHILRNLLFPDFCKQKRFSNIFTRINASKQWTWNQFEKSAIILSENFHDFVFSPSSNTELLLSANLLSIAENFLAKTKFFNFDSENMSSIFKQILKKYHINISEVIRVLKRDVNLPEEYILDIKRDEFFKFENKNLFPLPESLPANKAFCKIYFEQKGELHETCSNPKFQVNNQFEQRFGFSAEFLQAQLTNNIQSCLTFGASVLSILANEETVQHFLKANEFQLSTQDIASGTLDQGPWMTCFPCSCILNLETASGEWKPFQVNSVSRQIMSKTHYLGEIRLYFTPCDI
eukprot:snap_masked-scaffold_51-processed-gene-1.16-mRNA-1 protein AED:1.00 eAED:1.00 QI:0/-1/0/0/-1/1/1/0/365